MIRPISITDFLFVAHRGKYKLFIKKCNGNLVLANKKDSYFIIGYKRDFYNKSIKDGEFIKLSITQKSFTVENDYYGALPFYYIKLLGKVYITSSLVLALKNLNNKIALNYKQLLSYFAFGYQTLDEKSHYTKVKVIQAPVKIVYEDDKLQKINKSRDIFTKNKKISYQEYENIILETISNKLCNVTLNKAIFCITGGRDSLLSGMLLSYLNKKTHTGTFGQRKSLDIKLGALRAKRIFNTLHHNFFVGKLKVKQDDLYKHADQQSGFGTLASIYFSKYFEQLQLLGYRYVIFSEHEYTRKMPRLIENIRNSYFTPNHVVEDYIIDRNNYNCVIEEKLNKIQSKYRSNQVEQWYYYDRNVRAQHWKSSIARHYGLTKINLAYDYNWIQSNFCFLKENGFVYERILNSMFNKLNINKQLLVPNYNEKIKDIPISPMKMIYDNKAFYCELLEFANSYNISDVFDFKLLLKRIRNRKLNMGDEWFVHRLLNLIAFSYKNKINLDV